MTKQNSEGRGCVVYSTDFPTLVTDTNYVTIINSSKSDSVFKQFDRSLDTAGYPDVTNNISSIAYVTNKVGKQPAVLPHTRTQTFLTYLIDKKAKFNEQSISIRDDCRQISLSCGSQS
jgi:hypothetical protein